MKLKWNRSTFTPRPVSMLGANGDACAPYCKDPTDVKPYFYKYNTSRDTMSGIADYFGLQVIDKEGCGSWGLLAAANYPAIPGAMWNGICGLSPRDGTPLKIPASWPEPKSTSRLVCPDGSAYPGTCGAGGGGTTKAGMGAGLILALVAAGAVVVYAVTRGSG